MSPQWFVSEPVQRQAITAKSLGDVRLRRSSEDLISHTTSASEVLSTNIIAPEVGRSANFTIEDATTQAVNLTGSERWGAVLHQRRQDIASKTRAQPDDLEIEVDNTQAANLTASERWTAAFHRIRLWSRTRNESEARLLKSSYVHLPLKSRLNLRLLRLLPIVFGEVIKCEIIQAQPHDELSEGSIKWAGEPFEAVSWWWSRETPNSTMCIRKGSEWCSFEIPPTLDACLKALRLADKPRLLWIDYLCSDRAGSQEVEDSAKLFSFIFSAAENVCVWLGEEIDSNKFKDRSTNLEENVIRYVGSKDGSNDSVINSIRRSLATLQVSSVSWVHWELLRRPWFSRRWVIQEVARARRCQIHCGRDSISWNEFALWVSWIADHEFSQNDPTSPPPDLHRWHAVRLFRTLGEFSMPNSGDSLSMIPLASLEHLVTTFSGFEVSMPHDTVYSLLSLAAKNGMNTPQNYPVKDTAIKDSLIHLDKKAMKLVGYHMDYNQPYDEFCQQFIQFCILSSHYLNIICVPWAPGLDALPLGYPSRFTKLPSWISTMNTTPRRTLSKAWFGPSDPAGPHSYRDILATSPSQETAHYAASGESRISLDALRFRKCGRLFSMYVRGFVLGRMISRANTSLSGNIPSDWASFAGWTDLSQNPPVQYTRTLVADRGISDRRAPRLDEYALRQLYSSRIIGGYDIPTEDMAQALRASKLTVEFGRRVCAVIQGRTLVRVSQVEALALVPQDTQTEDLICVFYGCSVPVVLRRRPKTKTEIWAQRERAMRDENAAVCIQRTYRHFLLRRFHSSSKISTYSTQSRRDKLPYLETSILLGFLGVLCWFQSLPITSASSFILGLAGFSVWVLLGVYYTLPVPLLGGESQLAGEPVARSSATPPRPALTLSKPESPYCFSLIGECYVDGMMYGEAIDFRKEQRIPDETFELV